MRFLLDHDVPDDIVFALEALGHEVSRLRELMGATASDEQVLGLAGRLESVLITCNRDDFLALADRGRHAGIICSGPPKVTGARGICAGSVARQGGRSRNPRERQLRLSPHAEAPATSPRSAATSRSPCGLPRPVTASQPALARYSRLPPAVTSRKQPGSRRAAA